jgi:peptidoglycan/LPS O-acetylase OafA/YrhL
MERLAAGATYASYLDFWPSVLEGRAYPAGSTSWHHLWFIAYLFGYSILVLPLLAWLRGARRARIAAPLARAAAGSLLWVPAVALGLVLALMLPRWPGPQDVVHDWAMLVYYLAYFVIGALVAEARGAWEALERRREGVLRVAVLSLLACGWVRWNDHSPEPGAGIAWAAYALLLATLGWSWVLAILAYGRRYLSRTVPALDWAREASYPVYVLHQTVIVVVAAYVVRTPESILAKFAFTTVLSLALTVLLYQTLVRPFAPMRVLFGLKPLARPAALAARAAEPAGRVAPGAHAA